MKASRCCKRIFRRVGRKAHNVIAPTVRSGLGFGDIIARSEGPGLIMPALQASLPKWELVTPT